MSNETSFDAGVVVRDAVSRSLAVVGLAGVALIHVLDAHDTFVSTPYKGWMYVALIAGCLGTAVALVRSSDRRVWLAGMLLPAAALLAFVYSRTVGMPGGADDIGNWWEPLGLASVAVESFVIALCGAVLYGDGEPGAVAAQRSLRDRGRSDRLTIPA